MGKKSKKIILVEDDPTIVDVYSIMMKKEDFDVQAVSSGQEAIKIINEIATANEGKPDVILLDLILPDVDGMEVFKEVKKNDKTKDIKVFILTNQQDSQLHWPGGVKPDKYLIKANTSPSQLLGLIKEQLK